MSKKEKPARPALFTIRADDEFWDALDRLQASRLPVRDRSSIVKELVFREAAKLEKTRK
jgi:predicted transcriptional regulator